MIKGKSRRKSEKLPVQAWRGNLEIAYLGHPVYWTLFLFEITVRKSEVGKLETAYLGHITIYVVPSSTIRYNTR